MTRNKNKKATPLPVREGISPNHVWLPVGNWATMLEFLAERFPGISETVWRERMARGNVADEQGTMIDLQSPYRAGARLYYYRELESETVIPFEETIIFQNEHILVADKPHFLPVAPSGRFLKETLLARLKRKLCIDHLVPLHRLDRETAGLVIFSKNILTRDLYHALFRERRICKTYEALARFDGERSYPFIYRSRLAEAEEFYRRREIPGEPNSETHIDIIELRGESALYKLNPVTGKTHQLRVHMAALGMPIVNDVCYPVLRNWKGDDFSNPLQLLAKSLDFADPVSGEACRFVSARKL
ncbi:MAG: tRNA pseudouridine32 synthase / rRNA pseudouridine746 synthase [Pseudomonadota bacterium]|nr:tRNA pseudouridine32 synthase / rRNA pseudouridine746 synthase [Pseudomonadota bacterium]